ncbi:MAG: hypothetical protein GX814_03790 [Microbacteriaceae bacterium]|nr:hypothetical protein [Microbacteriaceae bacterium]
MVRSALDRPRSGHRAARTRRTHAALWAIPALVACTAFVAPLLAPAAAAADTRVTEDEVVAVAAPNVTLIAAPATPTLDLTADSFEFRAVLRNLEDEPLAPGSISLSITPTDTEQTAEQSEDDASDTREVIAEADTAELAAGAELIIEFAVNRSDLPLALPREPGVYALNAQFDPIEATAVTTDNTALIASTTHFVWGPIAAAQPIPYTLIVPLVLPETVLGIPTADELANVAPALLTLLTAAEEQFATIAVDPRILVGTRGLGENAPANARELVQRLEARASSVFLLQLADADVSVQAALGFEQLLEPLGFDYITQLGSFPVPETPDPADPEHADATAPGEVNGDEAGGENGDPTVVGDDPAPADPGEPVDPADPSEPSEPITGVPTTAELMTLEGSRLAAWPAPGDTGAATLALLERSGITTVVLDASNVRDATAPHATIGSFEAIISDDIAGTAVTQALTGSTVTERTAGLAALSAQLALGLRSAAPGMIIAFDRGATAQSADPTLVFQLLQTLSWAQPVAEQAQATGTAQLWAGESLEERRELLRAALTRSAEIDALAPLLETPDYLPQYQRVRVLEAFATRYASPHESFTAKDAEVRERDEQLLRGVQPVTTDSTQLVGTLTRVPVRLTNALPFQAKVSLRATATSATISVQEHRFETVVPTTGNTSVLVPVRSRVSSGEAGLLLEVRDVNGEHTYASARQPLTLRASVETIMLSVLGGATVLLIGFGVWRSIRRRRTTPTAPAE